MLSFHKVIILTCLLQLSFAQILSQGRCNPNIRTVENFDAHRYLGRWYEQQKYPFIFELGGKCVYADYGLLKNGDVRVYNYNKNIFTNKPNDILGSAKIAGPGKLKVKFNNMPSFIGPADYWILATDYVNYAVVFSCTDLLGVFNGQVAWILTRKRNPDPRYIQLAHKVLKWNGISLKPLLQTDQSGC